MGILCLHSSVGSIVLYCMFYWLYYIRYKIKENEAGYTIDSILPIQIALNK